MQLKDIHSLVQHDLADVDQLISRCLSTDISLISQLSQHIIFSGGKRMRPLLVLLSAHALGYQGQTHIELGAIIEIIHTATLLHDDVVDMSHLRRGRQTANDIWGNPASVLVGDFLYSRAFQMMVGLNNMQVMGILASSTNTIVQGEVLQLINCNDPQTTEERYMEVIRYKTGTLFEAAAQLGAAISDCTTKQLQAMAQYGMHLGTAFQLVDDALDYCASTSDIGKNIGDDLAEGKPTLPLIYAMQAGTTQQQQLIKSAIEHGNIQNLDEIIQTIESTQAIQYTYEVAKQQIQKAIQNLNEIPDSPYHQALHALAQFAIERQN